jgi:hypothetical protein
MSMTEYAAHRGVSHVAVHKAIKAGRISTINGKIDPKVADIQWAQNTRPRAAKRPNRDQDATAATAPAALDAVPPMAAPAVPPLGAADDRDDDYWTARAKRERAEAAISEMKRAEMEGKLIRTDAVRAAWAKRITLARDALLQIPHRLAPVLAAESDMERVAQLLEDELRNALAELSRGDTLTEVPS